MTTNDIKKHLDIILPLLPDFCVQFFPNKELRKIHGAPNFPSLQEQFNQEKSNSSSFPPTIEVGIHGHLGAYTYTIV